MRPTTRLVEIYAAGAALYFLRSLWLSRGRDDEGGRHERRTSLGGLLLMLMIPVADLLEYGNLSTGVMWLLTVLGIGVGALGYRWLMAKPPNGRR